MSSFGSETRLFLPFFNHQAILVFYLKELLKKTLQAEPEHPQVQIILNEVGRDKIRKKVGRHITERTFAFCLLVYTYFSLTSYIKKNVV
jgi:hypothetical protein